MHLTIVRSGGKHSRLDLSDDRMKAFDFLLGSEVVVLSLGGVWVEVFVSRHDGGQSESNGKGVEGRQRVL